MSQNREMSRYTVNSWINVFIQQKNLSIVLVLFCEDNFTELKDIQEFHHNTKGTILVQKM